MLDKILSFTKLNGECMEWQRCLNSDGYPRMAWNGSTNGKVHRIVASLLYGDIDGLVVRHTCDNPRCINPKHLIVGTHADNMADRDERERHGQARLSHAEVRQIRDLCKSKLFTNVEIGKMYSIDPRTVSSIKLGHHWKHVL